MLVEVDPVVNRFAEHVCGREVHDVARLAGVGPKGDSVEALGGAKGVDDLDIGPEIVKLPGVGRILRTGPLR